ncbi:ankyrin repeat-containing domain protein [Ilyonectria sp. MPI-CAGE-AT-0026]|nr:ankyrin repeat-containing domain protein [Ilyonectria sp. MPI-CAGE-AT-0026]
MPVDWKHYEKDINDQYVNGGKNIEETLKYLRETYGIDVTVRQFKSKFGGLKKIRADEWKAIFSEIRRREAQGINSDVYLFGRKLSLERIAREKRRYFRDCTVQKSHEIDLGIGTIGRHRLEIRNPDTTNLDLVQHDGSHALHEPTAIIEIRGVQDAELQKEPTAESICPDPATHWDLADLDLSTPRLDDHTAPLDLGSPDILETSITRSSVSPRPHCRPAIELQFGNELSTFQQYRAFSPAQRFPLFPFLGNSTGVVGLAGQPFRLFWDTTAITSLIPSIIEPVGFVSDELSAAKRSEMPPRVPWGMSGYLLSHLMSVDPKLKVLEPAARFIEEIIEKTGSRLDKILVSGAFYPHLDVSQLQLNQIFSLIAYLISNNLLHQPEAQALFQWARDKGFGGKLKAFCQTNSEHVRSYATKVLQTCHASGPDSELFSDNLFDMVRQVLAAKDRGLSPRLHSQLLRQAIHSENLEQARFLVSNGADFNDVHGELACHDGVRYDVLCHAIHYGSTEMLRLFIKSGGIVKPSALTVAMNRNRIDMADILLQEEAKIKPLTNKDYSFLVSAKNNSPHIYQALRERIGKHKVFEMFDLLQAAEQGNVVLSKLILQKGISKAELEEGLCEAIEHDEQAAVMTFINRGVDPNAQRSRRMDNRGGNSDEAEECCPMLVAIENGRLDGIYLLIKAGAKVNDGLLMRICHLAYDKKADDFFFMLLQRGYDVALIGPCALERCASDGEIHRCGIYLDAGAPINAYGCGGKNALQVAARRRHLALVQYLVGRGADVNFPASEYRGQTALQAAISGRSLEVAEWIIEAGADVKAAPATHHGVTVLEAAVGSRQGMQSLPKFKYLLALGAPINRPDGESSTVLHRLIRFGEVECLKVALEAGARMEDRESADRPMTPLQLAAERGDTETIMLLVSHGADINAPAGDIRGRTALQAAAGPGAIPSVQRSRTSTTAKSNLEIVEYLLLNHADVNAPAGKEFGRTALQAATSSEFPDPRIVALLLDHGADINAAPARRGGVSALQGAAIKGDLQIARLLLKHGADVNAAAVPEEGRTAVEGAAEHGRMDMVRLLLNAGARPDPVNGFSRAIGLADQNDHYVIGDLLKDVEQSFLATGWSDLLEASSWPLLPDQGMIMPEEEGEYER